MNEKIKNYLNNLPANIKNKIENNSYDIWNFDNDELLELVLKGKKLATTELFINDTKVPKEGSLAIITNTQKDPCCIVEYTKIEIKTFLEVGFEFALLEGEGFKNIEEWRSEHSRFFLKINNNFTENSLVVCENFKLVYYK